MATSNSRAAGSRVGAPTKANQMGSAAERYRGRGQQGATNTHLATAADLRSFEKFCKDHGLKPYPASLSALSDYVAHLADKPRKLATIQRHLASIQKQHRVRGLKSAAGTPAFLEVMQGIARTLGSKQKRAPAFSVEYLKSCIKALDLKTTAGLRDRAILLLGFAGAFRRSELVGIDLENIELDPEALVIRLGSTKTNQTGADEEKVFFYAQDELFCPIRAYLDWLRKLDGRTTGPLFVGLSKSHTTGQGKLTMQRLSAKSVNTIVGRRLGVDSNKQRFTAHSFRSSFITTAKLAGQSNDFIRNQTNHKTDAILARYTRLTDKKAYNAGKALGL